MRNPTAQTVKMVAKISATLGAILGVTASDGNLKGGLLFCAGWFGALALLLVVARVNMWNFDRKAPQREAEAKTSAAAFWAKYDAQQVAKAAQQSTADYLNYDGPYTVNGQPR